MADRKDILLAALAISNSRALTPVQVQKAMFLIAAEAKHLVPGEFYSFAKYNYGPFASDIYADLSRLEAAGWVIVDQTPGSKVRSYRLTDVGARSADECRAKLSQPLRNYLRDVVAWVTSLSFPELVRAIYSKYPEYKENSVFSG